jgi:hypothetical protein
MLQIARQSSMHACLSELVAPKRMAVLVMYSSKGTHLVQLHCVGVV